MSRVGDAVCKIGRWIWYLCGVGLLVLLVLQIVRRWRLIWGDVRAEPRPIKPADIVWEPLPTPDGLTEADRAEALRKKVEGMR